MSGAAARSRARARKSLTRHDQAARLTRVCRLQPFGGVFPTQTSPWSGAALQDLQRAEIRMILVTGSNIGAMEQAALALFRAGHVPVLGEWLASPLAAGERTFEDVYTPLLE